MRIIPLLAAAAVLAAASPSALAQGGDGKLAFNNACRTCHTLKEGDNRLGPNLAGIVGRKTGSVEGYANYSSAMKSAGVTWDEATLDKFIANPDATVPGHSMKPFGGIAEAAERKKIVDFLKAGAGD